MDFRSLYQNSRQSKIVYIQRTVSDRNDEESIYHGLEAFVNGKYQHDFKLSDYNPGSLRRIQRQYNRSERWKHCLKLYSDFKQSYQVQLEHAKDG